jgi:hypothetical protein
VVIKDQSGERWEKKCYASTEKNDASFFSCNPMFLLFPHNCISDCHELGMVLGCWDLIGSHSPCPQGT